MPIRIDKFLGMIPKLHPAQLPDGASVVCHNFVPSSGALVPFSATGPFTVLHDEAGLLLPGIPATEVVTIAKPVAPTLKSKAWQCRPGPGNWLNITLATFLSVVDAAGGRATYVWHALPMVYRYHYTERGMNLFCYAGVPGPLIMPLGGPYYFRGPRFMFSFGAKPGVYGGPATAEDVPGYVLPGSPVYSRNAIPLINAAQNVYGEFQVVDYSGPVWDEDFMVSDYETYTYWFAPFYCSFRIDLNYAEPRRTHNYYVTAEVDDQDREGPPSEISPLIVVRPGEIPTVHTPHTARRVRLYRSETGRDVDFRLIEEGTFVEYEDPPTPAQDDEIPPFGDWAATGAPSVVELLRGSVAHPAGFLACFYGDTVWLSDLLRLHVLPEENTHKFQEPVLALAMAGDTILVFTETTETDGITQQGGVYAISGNDPSQMACYKISGSTPLLNVVGLAQVGNMVYWPTYDGLAVSNGSTVEIPTSNYWLRKDWIALQPELMMLESEHDCLYLNASFTPAALPPSGPGYHGIHIKWETLMLPTFLGAEAPGSGLRLRIDLKDELAAVTTFSGYDGGGGIWRSRLFEFPVETAFDFIRVGSSSVVTVVATIDGVDQAGVDVPDDDKVAVTWPHGRYYQFTFRGTGTITSFEAEDRVIAAGQDVLVFTPETVSSFRNVRFRYSEPQTIAAIALTCQSAAAVTLSMYEGAEVDPFYTLTGIFDRIVPIPLASRVRATDFRIEVDTEVRIEQLVVAREVSMPAGEVIQEANAGLVSSWLTKVYTFVQGAQTRSVRVSATEPVTMRLYYDDATTPSEELEIGDAWEHRVVSASFTRLRYCFVDDDDLPADHLAGSVVVATSVPTEAPAEGVHLLGAPAYRGQVYRFHERGRYSAIQVTADAYPLWLDIYEWADREDPAYTVVISDDKTVALPWDVSETPTLWEFDLRSTKTGLETRVHGMHLYPKTGVQSADDIHVGNSGGGAPWLWARYEFERATRFCSRRIETVDGQSVWVQLYIDEAAYGEPLEWRSGYEKYFADWPGVLEGRQIEFRFFESETGKIPADYRVLAVHLYILKPEAVSDVAIIGDYPYLWREFTFAHSGRFTAAQVVLRDGYEDLDLIPRLRLRCGAEEQAVTLTGATAFALPSMAEGAQWDVCVENPVGVKQVVLYAEQTVPAGAGIETHAKPGAPDWLRSRYEFKEATVLAGVRVEASSYPVTLEAETDAGTLSVVVTAEAWQPTGWTAAINRAVFRFKDGAGAAADGFVRCLRLVPQQEVLVGADGLVHLTGLPFYWGIRLRFANPGAWAGVSVDAEAEADLSLEVLSGAAYTAVATISANSPDLERVKSAGESLQHALTDPTYSSLWMLDIECAGIVHDVILVAWQPQDTGPVVEVSTSPGIPAWYRTRYRLDKERVPRSVWVRGEADLDLYCGTSKETISAGETERRISTRHECSELIFDFETIVESAGAMVSCEEHVVVSGSGEVALMAGEVRAWRNKVLRFANSGAWAGISVDADESVTVTLEKVDGTYTARASIAAEDSVFHRLKSNSETLAHALTDPTNGDLWYLDLICTGTIHSVIFVAWQSQDVGEVVQVSNSPGIPDWYRTRYRFQKLNVPRSIIVSGSSDLDLYMDTVKDTVPHDDDEQRFDTRRQCSVLVFDFEDPVDTDGATVFCEEHVPVKSTGLVLRQADGVPAWRNKVFSFNEPGAFSVVRARHCATVRFRPFGGSAWTSVAIDTTDYTVVLPILTAAREWEVDFIAVSGERVSEVLLFTRAETVLEDGVARWTREGDVYTWLDKRVIVPRGVGLTCARVVATGTVTIWMRDKERNSLYTTTVLAGTNGFRLPRLDWQREFVFDLAAAESVEIEAFSVATGFARL